MTRRNTSQGFISEFSSWPVKLTGLSKLSSGSTLLHAYQSSHNCVYLCVCVWRSGKPVAGQCQAVADNSRFRLLLLQLITAISTERQQFTADSRHSAITPGFGHRKGGKITHELQIEARPCFSGMMASICPL